jgi:hypothetical protein
MDLSNLVLHEVKKNVKLDSTYDAFYWDYDIMIDKQGNILIEKILCSNLKEKSIFEKQIVVKINDNKPISFLIIDYYRELIQNLGEDSISSEMLDIELKKILTLRNTDEKLLGRLEQNMKQLEKKVKYYEIKNEILNNGLTNYKSKIERLREVIDSTRKTHSHEIEKLMITIRNIYREL